MVESNSDQPDDTMQGRVPGSQLGLWFLMEADRRVVALTQLLLVFGTLVLLGVLFPMQLREAMMQSDPVETLFQAFVAAIITGVTLVVTINQLVLSQELGALGDQRERMVEAMSFRRDVEAMLASPVSPPEPSSFLRAIVDVTGDRADELRNAVAESPEEAFRKQTEDYAFRLAEHAKAVSNRLDDVQFGTFGVLLSALDFNYSWKIYEARRLRNEHEEILTVDIEAAFDDLLEALELFGPAREHIKTLYFQWELINLSRSILYASLPALLVAIGTLLFLNDPGTISGTIAGVDTLVWVVSAATTIALIPFVLLLAYVLRIATVAQRTLAIGPLILRESERTDDLDWD